MKVETNDEITITLTRDEAASIQWLIGQVGGYHVSGPRVHFSELYDILDKHYNFFDEGTVPDGYTLTNTPYVLFNGSDGLTCNN